MNYSRFYLLFILAACSFRELEDAKPKNLSFILSGGVTVVNQETIRDNSLWRFPSLKEVDLRVCVKDRTNLSLLANVSFSLINKDNGEEKLVTSDINGCIYWRESVPFNYLDDEQYFTLSRRLVGLNEYFGIEDFELAIDPWVDNSSSVVDLRYASIDKSLLKKSDDAYRNNLMVKSASVVFQEEEYTIDGLAKLQMDLSFAPRIVRREIQGRLHEENLVNGEFFLKTVLTERAKDGSFKVVSIPDIKKVFIDERGLVHDRSTMQIFKNPENFEGLVLAMRLDPIDAPDGLSSEEGTIEIYALNEGVNSVLKRDASISEFFEKDFYDYASSIQKQVPEDQIFGFNIDMIDVRFAREVDNDVRYKDVTYDCTVCLYDDLIKKSIKDRIFKIDVVDSDHNGEVITTLEAKTNSNGCIMSDFTSTIDYFEKPGEFLNRKLVIRGLSSPYKGIERTTDFSIYPWEQVAWAGQQTEVPVLAQKKNNKVALKVSNISYHNKGDDEKGFKLSRYLDLWLKREYTVQFDPKLVIGHSYTKDSDYYPVDDVEFDMSVAILAPDGVSDVSDMSRSVKDLLFLTGGKGSGTARNGKLVIPFNLMLYFNHLPLLQRKTMAIFKLEAKNLETTYMSIPFSVIFNPDNNINMIYNEAADWITLQDSSDLEDVFNNIDNITKNIDAHTRDHSPQELFLDSIKEHPNLKILNVDDFSAFAKLKRDDVLTLLNNKDANILKNLCGTAFPIEIDTEFGNNYFTKGNTEYRNCVNDPEKYFNMTNLSHIEEVMPLQNDDAGYFYVNPYIRNTVATGHYVFDEERDIAGAAFRYMSMKFDLSDTFTALNKYPFKGFAGSLDTGPRRDKQVGWANRVRLEDSADLVAHNIRLNFRAAFKKCFTLQIANKSELFYVCDDNVYKEKLKESWYYIFAKEEEKNFRLIDPREHRNKSYIMLIRGESAYKAIVDTVSSVYNDAFFVYTADSVNPSVYVDKVFRSVLIDQIALGTIEGTLSSYEKYERESQEWMMKPFSLEGMAEPFKNIKNGW